MKISLSLTALALTLLASSCRTAAPIDPMTGKPSAKLLPAQYKMVTTGEQSIHATK